MLNITGTLLILFVVNFFLISSIRGAANFSYSSQKLGTLITHKEKYLTSNSSNRNEYLLSQLSENKRFYIELSYNSDHSDVLSRDVLSKALREMTTIFIGSGFTYVEKEQADLIAKVFIDAEISDYKRGDADKYDFLSKVTIKLYEKGDRLLEQANKNVFLSGDNLNELAVDSISKSSTLAAKEIVGNLREEDESLDDPVAVVPALKVELLFEGSANYKFYESINKIMKESVTEIKVLKRTIRYGDSISMLVLSKLGSQQLAELVIDGVSNKDSVDVINVTDNRVVFRIN